MLEPDPLGAKELRGALVEGATDARLAWHQARLLNAPVGLPDSIGFVDFVWLVVSAEGLERPDACLILGAEDGP